MERRVKVLGPEVLDRLRDKRIVEQDGAQYRPFAVFVAGQWAFEKLFATGLRICHKSQLSYAGSRGNGFDLLENREKILVNFYLR
jgi:hypothetical protein